MTEQIAPSLATAFEQGARELVEFAREQPCDDADCPFCTSIMSGAELLTRAAAMARAAEKITEWFPLRIDRDEMGYECVFCYGWHLDTPEVEHKADCAWMQLRALVSSEGKGE